MKKEPVKAVSTICVLGLSGMLIAACLAFVFKNETPMYDFSGVKAHFEAWGWVYLALLIALGAAGATHAFLKNTPEAHGKGKEYRRANGLKARTEAAVRLCLLAIAMAMLIPGIINGGLYDVFVKAVNICTECIGLG